MAKPNDYINEYIKCSGDYAYYSSKYAHVYNVIKKEKIFFKLFGQQKELLDNLQKHDFNLVLKARQTGISTTLALYCVCELLFRSNTKIMILAHKRDGAEEFLNKVHIFLKDKPKFLDNIKLTTVSKSRLVLSNDSECRAFSSSTDSLRGFTPSFLIIDECAFIPNADEIWTATAPVLSTGGKACLLSTPNSHDKLFYKTYEQIEKGKSNFHLTKIYWWLDDRYNKGLWWEMENPETEQIEVLKEKDRDLWFGLYKQNWKPKSQWFLGQCKTLNNDPRRIAQEFELDFLASGDLIVPSQKIAKIENMYIIPPIRVDEKYTDVWYFSEPKENASYVISVDVSSGSADDFSAFMVICVEDNEMVCEYHGKTSADHIAYIIKKVGEYYNKATAIVDVTGGLGELTIFQLYELEYQNIYFRHIKYEFVKNKYSHGFNNVDEENKRKAGFAINSNNRNIMIEEFAKQVRDDEFIIRSSRLLSELKTFVYGKDGRANHRRSDNDDLLFSVFMGIYVITFDYQQLKNNQTSMKKILDAWLDMDENVGIREKYVSPKTPQNDGINIFREADPFQWSKKLRNDDVNDFIMF